MAAHGCTRENRSGGGVGVRYPLGRLVAALSTEISVEPLKLFLESTPPCCSAKVRCKNDAAWSVARVRHAYATEMLRAGVTLPSLVKLLGHSSADMTMRYLKVTLPDVQREFHLARLQPDISHPNRSRQRQP